MATLKEIALRADVSIATVSRTLNFDQTLSISDDKKKIIFEIAEELDYKTPRRKKIERKPNYKIALVYWYSLLQELDDPYYISIRRGIEVEARNHNINIVKIPKNNEHYAIDSFKDVDGIITVGRFPELDITLFKNYTENLVCVDFSPVSQSVDSIVLDFKKSMKLLIDYVTDTKGYKEVGFIGGEELVKNEVHLKGDAREVYFRRFMKDKELLKEKYIYIDKFTSLSGYESMKAILATNDYPKAFIAASDSIAIGAMKAINETGLNIPNDIAIVGFNDISNAEFTFPPLTTLAIPTEFMGHQAINILLGKINGRDVHIKMVVETKLVERNTM